MYLKAKPSARPGVTADAENDRSKKMNENKKKISHLKNIDSKLANHILDEIVERYMYSHVLCIFVKPDLQCFKDLFLE